MIYFIQGENGGPIKIGYTKNLVNRMFVLQEGNPYKLVVLGTMDGTLAAEQRLHTKFEKHRFRSEWFEDCEEIREFIKHCNEFDYRTLLMIPKKPHKKPRSFGYREFIDRYQNTIKVNRWTREEAITKTMDALYQELRTFGHTEHRSKKLAFNYRSAIIGMVDYSTSQTQILLPIDCL